MKAQIRRAARRFGAVDFLKFDPLAEAVPTDVPEQCGTCESDNPRGRRNCRRCGNSLSMMSRYGILCDALIATYTGDRYGVPLGRSFADVTQLLPRMRPYPKAEDAADDQFTSVAYAITHVIYTLNDYGAYRLRVEWLPHEFEYLKANLKRTIAMDDPETTGEFLDTLKSFGLTEEDPLVQAGTEFVLSRQNRDGSWGNLRADDIYERYHPTWTAIGGLMDYAWRGEGVSFSEALRRASDA